MDEVLRRDVEYQLLSRDLRCNIAIHYGPRELVLRFEDGGVELVPAGYLSPSWRFGFAGPRGVWDRFLQDVPPPLYQDLFALLAHAPGFRLLGDALELMQRARAVHRASVLFREVRS